MNTQSVLRAVFVMSIFIFLLCTSIGRLHHGGIHLLSEKNSDAIEMQGEIQSIKELGGFSFPRLGSNYGYGDSNGVQFTINGVKCTAPVKGNLSVGDYVKVLYLPQSGYVLSIESQEELVGGTLP